MSKEQAKELLNRISQPGYKPTSQELIDAKLALKIVTSNLLVAPVQR